MMPIQPKFSRTSASALFLSLAALSLSACSTVNAKSKMSSQSVFDSASGSSYAIAPTAYDCGANMSCKVLSPSDCPVTRPVRQTRMSVVEIQCYDGSIVSDVSQCGPIPLSARSNPIPVPAQYVQAAASLCDSGMSDTVYYDFNVDRSSETSAAASRVLEYGRQCNISSVQVFGHTDRSGAELYNEGLSRRRAQDVKRELIRQGLTSVPITAQPMGETQPAIERGDGVREPMNRRSEIQVQSGRRTY